MEKIEITQKERINILKEKCNAYHYNKRELLQNVDLRFILIDQKHKFLYCLVPKVACTNWKWIMLRLMGKINETEKLDIPEHNVHKRKDFVHFDDFSLEEKETIINEYTKLITVRHPFERILSAYRSKLAEDTAFSDFFQVRYGRKIIKAFRKNPSKKSLALGNDVTFKEFVQFLLTPKLSRTDPISKSYDRHWEPMEKLCHPCLIEYNVIAKYENINEESDFVLHKIGAQNISLARSKQAGGTRKMLKEALSDLTEEMILGLYEIYKKDFELFDYKI